MLPAPAAALHAPYLPNKESAPRLLQQATGLDSSKGKEAMTAYYTIREAAEILGIPRGTLYRHAREGQLEHLGAVRIGTRTFIPKISIDPKEAA